MVPEELREAVNAVVPPGVTHIGFVATNRFGDFSLTEPKNHPHGVVATHSKVRVEHNEEPFDTLVRCIRDQIGAATTGAFPIPCTWVTSQSSGFYFAGMLWNEGQALSGGSPHYQNWWDTDAARNHVSRSTNAESKRRDLALLDAASAMCLSPFRRILLMVRELHLLGFERLRAPACEYPLAWRCPIVPAYWTLQSNGGMLDDPASKLEELFGHSYVHHTYSAADGQFPFGWKEAAFDSPKELANRFIENRQPWALAGWGPDSAYVRWFQETLEATKPNGLYSSHAEYKPPSDSLYTIMAKVERVSLPPPGWAREGEFQGHFNKHEE